MIKLNLELSEPGPRDAAQLRALAAMFLVLADGSKADQVRATLDAKGPAIYGAGDVAGKLQAEALAKCEPLNVTATLEQYGRTVSLDPADNPAAGLPTPGEAFGAGSVVAGSGSAPSPSPASTSAGLTTGQALPAPGAALPDPATAFGGAVPNAPAGAIAGTPAPAPASASIPPAPLPVPPAAAAPAGVELDAAGLPWDARINSVSTDGGHPKKQDGTWKVKRGTGETFLKEVQAQLRAALAAGGNVAPPPPPTAASAPATIPPVPAGAASGNVQPPAAGATNSPPALPATTSGTGGCNTMAQLLPRVTAAITAGALTAEQAGAITLEISQGQINNVAMLAVAPALIPAFSARLDALGIPQ